MNKQQVVIDEQSVGDATTGFTSSLKPEVTNGRNEVDQKRSPILTMKDNTTGDMVGQYSVDDKEDESDQVDPGTKYSNENPNTNEPDSQSGQW